MRYMLHRQPDDCMTESGPRFSIFEGNECIMLFNVHPPSDPWDERKRAQAFVDLMNKGDAPAFDMGDDSSQ